MADVDEVDDPLRFQSSYGGTALDKNLVMTFDDFAAINTRLLQKTVPTLYRSESYEHHFRRMEQIDPAAWADSGMRAFALLIGSMEDEGRILGPKQFDVKRAARVGFVSVSFGEETAETIGVSP